jgi:hypothetical protein
MERAVEFDAQALRKTHHDHGRRRLIDRRSEGADRSGGEKGAVKDARKAEILATLAGLGLLKDDLKKVASSDRIKAASWLLRTSYLRSGETRPWAGRRADQLLPAERAFETPAHRLRPRHVDTREAGTERVDPVDQLARQSGVLKEEDHRIAIPSESSEHRIRHHAEKIALRPAQLGTAPEHIGMDKHCESADLIVVRQALSFLHISPFTRG